MNMWPYNMTRTEVEDFLLDRAREFIDYMMTACSYEVESALTGYFAEDAYHYVNGRDYWEAC